MEKNYNNIIRTEVYHPVQLKVFFTMIVLYAFYYASHYNLGTAAKYIMEEYCLTNSEFGILFTIYTLSYGIGQFIMGFLGDRFNPKMLMFWGAIGSTAANIGFGLSKNMVLFSLFWGTNALFLSMGWSPGCSILFRWIPPKRWGLFMGIFHAFAFLGGVIIYPVAGFTITSFGWRSVFFVSPALLFTWSIVFFLIVKSNPEDAGLMTEWEKPQKGTEKHVTLKDYINIMKNPTIYMVCAIAVCSQFVRWGLLNWTIKILTESTETGGYGLALLIAASIASSMHWGGAFFSVIMGYLSDIVFHGSRWQTIAINFSISAISLAFIYFTGSGLLNMKNGIVILTFLLFLSGGCIQGAQSPIFNLPGDILGSRLGGTGVGIVNGWSYMGASLAGGAFGSIMDNFGLTSCIFFMALISSIGAILVCIIRK